MGRARTFHDGQTFGRWTIIDAYPDGSGMALCECECGTRRLVQRGALQVGMSKSCGICTGRGLPGRKMNDGDRFGAWTVVTAYPGGTKALCRCECGTTKLITRGHLQRGLTTRCLDCHMDWPKRLLNQSFGLRTVIEVDRDRGQVVLRCSRCTNLSIASLAYVRAKKRRYNPKCPHCETVCSHAAVAATGVTRQAISARMKNGWTREEAMTLRRGEVPDRIRAARG